MHRHIILDGACDEISLILRLKKSKSKYLDTELFSIIVLLIEDHCFRRRKLTPKHPSFSRSVKMTSMVCSIQYYISMVRQDVCKSDRGSDMMHLQ